MPASANPPTAAAVKTAMGAEITPINPRAATPPTIPRVNPEYSVSSVETVLRV